ncbi:MAG: TraB/GumN family protein, partial [Pseudomonadota bacterium]
MKLHTADTDLRTLYPAATVLALLSLTACGTDAPPAEAPEAPTQSAVEAPADTAVATPPAPEVAAGPALWKVEDVDTTVYLFGTFHALKPGIEWFNGPVRPAYESADEVAL